MTFPLRSAALFLALAVSTTHAADLTLWYNHPPTEKPDAVLTSNGVWSEALLIGNGRLGGQVWGGIQEDRIDFNEDSLWTGEPGYTIAPTGLQARPEMIKLLLEGKYAEAQQMYNQNMRGKGSATYLPMGDFRVKFTLPGEASNYRKELDLETANARVTFESGGVRFTREVIASYPGHAIFMNLSASQPGQISFTATFNSQLHNQVKAGEGALRMFGQAPMQAAGYSGRVTPPRYDTSPEPKGMFWEARLAAQHQGGTLQVTDEGIKAEKCDSVLLMLVANTSYNGPEKSPSKEGKDQAAACAKDLAFSSGQNFVNLKIAHEADYKKLFSRVSLDLGHSDAEKQPTDERIKHYKLEGAPADPSLPALYYQFGRYMMISASRGGAGGQPSNLQGLWNGTVNPPWASNWTINCNAEINYWPVEAANLGECHEPLIQMVQELSIDGARVAKEYYGARGWMAHHATDVWKFAAPCGSDARWSAFICGGTWFCQHLWEHYAFSQDQTYLRKVWPTLKGAAQYHLDTLVEEPTHHWLVTAPDLNFENQWKKPDGTTGSLCMGATPSLQMVRQIFRNCIEASGTLNQDAEFRTELEKALPRLAPMQISPTTGQLQEYLEDWSHVAKAQVLSSWGAICSDQINVHTSPELATGLKKIFDSERWWEKDCVGSWEGAFQANAYARLHDGDTALKVLDRHLQKAVLSNLGSCFIGHPPQTGPNPHPGMFQVDGNFGQTSGVNEMLLQSQERTADGGYVIELLPALPSAWKDGEVRGLRARGGATVDMAWKGGKLTSARITATAAVRTKVRYGDKVVDLALSRGEAKDFGTEAFAR